MQIGYQDPRFSFTGFWQENQENTLVSYKRVATFTVSFLGAEVLVGTCLEGSAQWYMDDMPVDPVQVDSGFRFRVPAGIHRLKAILVSPNRMYLRGAKTDGLFVQTQPRPYVQFIGDSITHAYPGFAAATGEALGVDYSVVAHPGMSLVDGWGWYPLTNGLKERVGMQSNYFQLETPDVSSVFTPHSFAHGRRPDVIVIYLGVNDYLTEGPTFQEDHPIIFADRYVAFVQRLRDIYPQATVVLLQCHLPDRKIRIDAIADAYEQMRQRWKDVLLTDTHLWDVDVCSDKVHPSEAGYAQISAKLTDILKAVFIKHDPKAERRTI